MGFEDLAASLELDASDFVSGAEDAGDASADLGQESEDTSDSLFELDAGGAAAGATLAGLGAAVQGVLDETQELRTSLDRTATTMGISSDEANRLVREMTDATLSHEDAAAAMDQFAQLGVESEEQMEEMVTSADDLADATGTSAESIATNLAPAVNALDGDLDALSESTDAFTLAARNSALDVEDLGSTIERLNFEHLQEMGIGTEEVTGLITQFAEETGFSGRQLRSNFNAAVEEADGDLDALTEGLGLSEDALGEWEQQLEDAEGITQEHAAAVAENTTFMDDMRASFDDVMLAAGGLLAPVDALAPALMGLGGALTMVSAINFGAVIPSIKGVAAALWASGIAPVLLAIGGAAVLLWAAWETNFGNIQDHTEAFVGFLTDEFGWVWDLVGATADIVGDNLGLIRDSILLAMGPIGWFAVAWNRNLLGIQDIVTSVAGLIADNFDLVVNSILLVSGPIGWLGAAWRSNFLGIQNITSRVLDWFMGRVETTVGNLQWAAGVIGDWADIVGDHFWEVFDDASAMASALLERLLMVPDGIAAMIDEIPGIDSEDVMGQVDTDDIMDTLFPPKPGEGGEQVGEEAGEGLAEGASDGAAETVPGGARRGVGVLDATAADPGVDLEDDEFADPVGGRRAGELDATVADPMADALADELEDEDAALLDDLDPGRGRDRDRQRSRRDQLSADDIAAALRDVLEGLLLRVEADGDLDDVIRDEARVVATDVVQSQTDRHRRRAADTS